MVIMHFIVVLYLKFVKRMIYVKIKTWPEKPNLKKKKRKSWLMVVGVREAPVLLWKKKNKENRYNRSHKLPTFQYCNVFINLLINCVHI